MLCSESPRIRYFLQVWMDKLQRCRVAHRFPSTGRRVRTWPNKATDVMMKTKTRHTETKQAGLRAWYSQFKSDRLIWLIDRLVRCCDGRWCHVMVVARLAAIQGVTSRRCSRGTLVLCRYILLFRTYSAVLRKNAFCVNCYYTVLAMWHTRIGNWWMKRYTPSCPLQKQLK